MVAAGSNAVSVSTAVRFRERGASALHRIADSQTGRAPGVTH